MQIIDYKHFHGTVERDGFVAIEQLHRTKASARQFIAIADLNVELSKPTAFLYINGFSISPSDNGLNANPAVKTYMPAIHSGTAWITHEWVHTFINKHYLTKVDILSGTCACGIQALLEADRILRYGEAEEVIIIGHERTTPDTLRLFKELKIPVTCGDGFAYMRLAKGGDSISDVRWRFQYSQNPFFFNREMIDSLIPPYSVDYVKVHGTGTESNEAAEAGVRELGQPIYYKPKIGHTQGISALLEICMVLADDQIHGKILCTANGFGGFYGACTVRK